jgi:hypothetical protein
LEDQAIIDDFRSLPGVNEVVADIDRIVANEMGVSVPESKRLQKMYEQGRMGKLPADAYALRKEAVEKNKDALQKKYPHIPSSFFDTYIGGLGLSKVGQTWQRQEGFFRYVRSGKPIPL